MTEEDKLTMLSRRLLQCEGICRPPLAGSAAAPTDCSSISSTVLRTQRIEESLKVLITWSKAMPEMAGRELADIAGEWGVGLAEAA